MKGIDLAFLGILGVFWIYFFWRWYQKDQPWIEGIIIAFYHFIITYFAYQYILEAGGDVLKYWQAAAFPKASRGDWVYVLPYSAKYFLWFIRPFASTLGLSFISGTAFFSSLSLLAFLWILQFVLKQSSHFQSNLSFFKWVFILILFLPNSHFWTSLLSKESLLFFLTVASLKLVLKRNFLFLPISILTSILVRPVFGIILLIALGFLLIQDKTWANLHKSIIVLLLISFGALALNYILIYLDDFEINFSLIENYAQYQYQRFEFSGASTIVPMENYDWFFRIFTVAFRPLMLEQSLDYWMIFVKIENTILLILSLGLPIILYHYPRLIPYFLLIIIYFFAIAIASNVMGVFIRLKSVLIPFFALMGGLGWSHLATIIFMKSRSGYKI